MEFGRIEFGRMEFGTALWSSPAWLASAVEWVDHRLADAGLRRTGPAEQPRVRPWATAVRVPTDHGVHWLKACGPGTAFEVPVYGVLTDLVPDHVLRPLAADPGRGWILLPDGGSRLDERLAGPALGQALGAAVVQYGSLQRDLTAGVGRLLAAGVPDMRPAAMLDAFDRAVAATAAAAAGHPQRAARHAAVSAARPRVREWCARLTGSAVPASLDHNDLHPGNIFSGPTPQDPVRFFDWGDAVVAHPFAAMLVPLGLVRHLLGEPHGGRRFDAVRDAYLDHFRPLAPDEDLRATLDLACRVASIARALTWLRAIGAAAEQDDPAAERFRDAPLDTLASVLDEDPLSIG